MCTLPYYLWLPDSTTPITTIGISLFSAVSYKEYFIHDCFIHEIEFNIEIKEYGTPCMLHLQEPIPEMLKVRSCFQPGEAVNGGYYAGTFRLNNENYALIVSPGSSGEFSNVHWEAYRQITHASSYIDGFANTVAMAESGHVISQYSLQILINGFQDWYIPSRDELELIYRNLKPTTDVNLTSFRDGENPSSIPPGYAYTKAVPNMTKAKLFQSRREQAMALCRYWSSTEASMYAAWTQHFKDGQHYTDHKIAAHNIRLVRKSKISE